MLSRKNSTASTTVSSLTLPLDTVSSSSFSKKMKKVVNLSRSNSLVKSRSRSNSSTFFTKSSIYSQSVSAPSFQLPPLVTKRPSIVSVTEPTTPTESYMQLTLPISYHVRSCSVPSTSSVESPGTKFSLYTKPSSTESLLEIDDHYSDEDFLDNECHCGDHKSVAATILNINDAVEENNDSVELDQDLLAENMAHSILQKVAMRSDNEILWGI